jgi:methylmalonyl-CoA epimerase
MEEKVCKAIILSGQATRKIKSMLQIELDHIGIAVRSLDEAASVYRALGFETGARQLVREHQVAVQWAVCPGATAGEGHIELLEAAGEGSVISRYLERSGPGLHHFALRVDNLERAIQHYREHGFELVGPPATGADGCRCVFLHPRSVGGVLVEVLEREIAEKRV